MKRDFDALVAGIYDAALDPGLWPTVLQAAALHFGASHSIVYTPDVPPQAGGFFMSHNVPPEMIAAHEAHYRPLDLWTLGHHARFGSKEGGFTGDMFVPFDILTKSEFYTDFLRPNGLHHLCTSVVHSRPQAGHLVSFAMFRGPRQSGFGQMDRQICGRLAPHVQRALVISERLQSSERARHVDATMLDSASSAIFLVNASAKVLRQTEAAERLVKTAAHLCMRSNRLCSASRGDRLEEAIREVAHGDLREPFSRLLVILGGEPPTRLHVLVVKAGMHLRGCAYVVVGPVATASSSRFGSHLQLVYRLTPAETKLCNLLKEGHSPKEAADLLSIKHSTAVSQLKSIFSKTETGRQSELIRLLIDLSAL
jgi:DNA-binding CsgD family transcriptional regulator